MRHEPDYDALVSGITGGERKILARALRWVDDEPDVGRELARRLYSRRNEARIIGVTGNPGAGKSTVVDALVAILRAQNKRVAVLAVDPSSPFSGGAILGDRIRMSRHFGDDGVYIRSLATRGAMGGLSRATFDAVRVLEAANFDVILLETVGVGQDEVDIVRLAQTTIVVTIPGLGDDVQAIKAGLLEIADIFVVNKADREGVDNVERHLKQLLSLVPSQSAWEPPILRTVAFRGQGLDDVWEACEKHAAFTQTDEGKVRAKQRTEEMFDRILDAALVTKGRANLGDNLEHAKQEIRDGSPDIYTLVHKLIDR